MNIIYVVNTLDKDMNDQQKMFPYSSRYKKNLLGLSNVLVCFSTRTGLIY